MRYRAPKRYAGYQLTVAFDTTALKYISSANGDYLSGNAFFIQPIVRGNRVTLASIAITSEGNDGGTLATLTFEVMAAVPISLNITDLILSDKAGKRIRATVKNEQEETK